VSEQYIDSNMHGAINKNKMLSLKHYTKLNGGTAERIYKIGTRSG